MTTEDRAPGPLHRLEHAMDTANELIGELIRRLEDGRPRLRVVGGGDEETVSPGDASRPRLRIVEPPAQP